MSKQKDRGKEEPMTMEHYQEEKENRIEGRNAVLEAIRADRTIERLYVQDGCKDGPVQTILREAKNGASRCSLWIRQGCPGCPRPGSTRG